MLARLSSDFQTAYLLPNLPVPDLRFQPESQRATSTSCSRFLSSCSRVGVSSSSCDPTPWYPDPACPRPSVRQPHIGTTLHLLLPGFQIHLPRLSPTIRPPTPYRYLSPTTCLPDADPTSVPDHESCLVSRQDKPPSCLCPVDPHLDPNPTRDTCPIYCSRDLSITLRINANMLFVDSGE